MSVRKHDSRLPERAATHAPAPQAVELPPAPQAASAPTVARFRSPEAAASKLARKKKSSGKGGWEWLADETYTEIKWHNRYTDKVLVGPVKYMDNKAKNGTVSSAESTTTTKTVSYDAETSFEVEGGSSLFGLLEEKMASKSTFGFTKTTAKSKTVTQTVTAGPGETLNYAPSVRVWHVRGTISFPRSDDKKRRQPKPFKALMPTKEYGISTWNDGQKRPLTAEQAKL